MASDAHMDYQIGDFSKAERILEAAGMPEELIMNLDEHRIIRYLINKGRL